MNAVVLKNPRGELINAGQTVTRKEALHLYTAANDWFLNADGKIGTIEEGNYGDLIALSDDYFDARKAATRAAASAPRTCTEAAPG